MLVWEFLLFLLNHFLLFLLALNLLYQILLYLCKLRDKVERLKVEERDPGAGERNRLLYHLLFLML